MSTGSNWKLGKYVSKVIECLEQNIGNKSIAKDHQIPNKWIDYNIFEFKYGNTKLLGNAKHNKVKLVPAVFVSAYLHQYSIKLY